MTMKLSEAIRLGAMLKPQAFGSLRSLEAVNDRGSILGLRLIEKTCAYGAAIDAGYTSSGRGDCIFVQTIHECPACGLEMTVGMVVMHLNDTHRWTRERIADFVATVEVQYEVFAPSPAAVPVEA